MSNGVAHVRHGLDLRLVYKPTMRRIRSAGSVCATTSEIDSLCVVVSLHGLRVLLFWCLNLLQYQTAQ
jgi:hypothetical protein